jgi:hypothetical protein
MMNYEKKMQAITLIAETLNPIPLRELINTLNEMAQQKDRDEELQILSERQVR